jgi:hypothetical protein
MADKLQTAADISFFCVPSCLQAATSPGVLETLQRCNETLEAVQKNLEDYLETKRVTFPRYVWPTFSRRAALFKLN